jgi:hypothetical protein
MMEVMNRSSLSALPSSRLVTSQGIDQLERVECMCGFCIVKDMKGLYRQWTGRTEKAEVDIA